MSITTDDPTLISGERLVFVAGAPGSKWSAVAHALSYADDMNLSDRSKGREYAGAAKHVGAYFGPGLEFGDRFHQLDTWSKSDLLSEFTKPYEYPSQGRLLLKAHLFSRHLPFLAEMFPSARFVLAHREDDACLKWWLAAGGFQISYPDYSWYQDEDRMRTEIATDNEGIKAFAESLGVKLARRRSMEPVLKALSTRYSPDRIREVASTEVEQRFGLGEGSVDDVVARCHAAARLAAIAIVSPGAASNDRLPG